MDIQSLIKEHAQRKREENGFSFVTPAMKDIGGMLACKAVVPSRERAESPPATKLVSSESDARSDFTGASTEVATNRAIDVAMNRIREIEGKQSYDTEPALATNPSLVVKTEKRTRSAEEVSRRQYSGFRSTEPGFKPQPMAAHSLLSFSSNEDSSRMLSPGPFLPPATALERKIARHVDPAALEAARAQTILSCDSSLQSQSLSSIGMDIRGNPAFPASLPTRKLAHRKPTPQNGSDFSSDSGNYENEGRSRIIVRKNLTEQDIMMPALRQKPVAQTRTYRLGEEISDAASLKVMPPGSSERGSSGVDELHTDPVFCPYSPEHSSRASFESDYVSRADFLDRGGSIGGRPPRVDEEPTNGSDGSSDPFDFPKRQINPEPAPATKPITDERLLKPHQSGEFVSAKLFRSELDTQIPVNASIAAHSAGGRIAEHGLGEEPLGHSRGVKENANKFGQTIDNASLKKEKPFSKATLGVTSNGLGAIPCSGDQQSRTRVQNYTRAVKRLHRSWPPQSGVESPLCVKNHDGLNATVKKSQVRIGPQAGNKNEPERETATPRKSSNVAAAFLAAISKNQKEPNVSLPFINSENEQRKLDSHLDEKNGANNGTNSNDVKSIRSAFESRHSDMVPSDEDGDDDDTASVKSLKERFEDNRDTPGAPTGVSRMRSLFETKRIPVSKRFEAANSTVKEVFSKFERTESKPTSSWGKSLKQTDLEGRRNGDEKDERPLAHEREEQEEEPPRVSVADRIRAIKNGQLGSRASLQKHIIKEATSNSSRQPEVRRESKRDCEKSANESGGEFQSSSTAQPSCTAGITGISKQEDLSTAKAEGGAEIHVDSKGPNVHQPKTTVKTPAPSPTSGLPSSRQRSGPVVIRPVALKLTTAGTAKLSPIVKPIDPGTRRIEKPTMIPTHVSKTARVRVQAGEDGNKFKSQSSNQPAAVTLPRYLPDPGHKDEKESSESTSEFSDGVTLDLSIADVSCLTTPTALLSKAGDKSVATAEEEQSATLSAKASSDMVESEAKRSEASSSQTSEAAAPLIAKAMRMAPMSDDLSTDSFFAVRALIANHWGKTSGWDNAARDPPIKEEPSDEHQDIDFHKEEASIGWDAERVATSFPVTNAPSSSRDIFDFESSWEMFPPATLPSRKTDFFDLDRSDISPTPSRSKTPTRGNSFSTQGRNEESQAVTPTYLRQKDAHPPTSAPPPPPPPPPKQLESARPDPLIAVHASPTSPISPPPLPRSINIFGRTHPGKRGWRRYKGQSPRVPEKSPGNVSAPLPTLKRPNKSLGLVSAQEGESTTTPQKQSLAGSTVPGTASTNQQIAEVVQATGTGDETCNAPTHVKLQLKGASSLPMRPPMRKPTAAGEMPSSHNAPVSVTSSENLFVRLPPHENDMESLYGTKHAALMTRLRRLKEARMRRAVNGYGTRSTSIFTPATRDAVNSDEDDTSHSNSTKSSTGFGGNTFLAALEVD